VRHECVAVQLVLLTNQQYRLIVLLLIISNDGAV
jgi:hypothetical protein